jgi:hypothetical protein
VIVTDERGAPLAAPLDTTSRVAWVGYANAALHRSIEPVLHRLLNSYQPSAISHRHLAAGRSLRADG